MARGKVKWYDSRKNFGFIIPDDDTEGKKDLFFHKSNLQTDTGTIEEETLVEFEVTEGKNGKKEAVNVRPVLDE